MNKQTLLWSVGVLGAALLLDALLLEKLFFETRRFAIGRKEGGKALRLLLVSDLHLKQVFWPYYARLARKINQLQPDLLLVAGDILDGHTRLPLVERFLELLDPDLPKVAVPGNHDYNDEASMESLRQLLRRHGGELLINQSKAYTLQGERVMISGLDDWLESEPCLPKAVEGIGHEAHHLLLIHSPLLQEKVRKELKALNRSRADGEKLNIRYIFAGHNHGGQVRFGGITPKMPDKAGGYVDGWYNEEPPYLYLSRGFGTSTVPFRFGSRSELALFTYYA